MNHLEILVAAEVGKICVDIATSARNTYIASITDEPNRDALLKQWEEEHPSSSYAPRAYAFLKKVAAEVARIDAQTE